MDRNYLNYYRLVRKMEIDVIGNGAYAGKENLKLTSEQKIKVVAKLNITISDGARKDEYKFYYNKEDQ